MSTQTRLVRDVDGDFRTIDDTQIGPDHTPGCNRTNGLTADGCVILCPICRPATVARHRRLQARASRW
jgi:hypothetical protein